MLNKKTFLTLLFVSVISYSQILDKKWITKFESSNFLQTADYDETIDYFKQIDDSSEFAKLIDFGVSPQGRNLFCLIVSKEKFFTADEAKKSSLPILFVLNGIHSGEIEGKDASMILLREILITKEKKDYLDKAIMMIVPIFSVDGHERKSPYNRINQNGPTEMGWRVTAQNFNLNRDWMKADAPEMKAMLKLLSDWTPDFFIDNHTTNGADYQYTFSHGLEKFSNIDEQLGAIVKNNFIPYLTTYIEERGFLVAPYIYFRGDGPQSGMLDWAAQPRFSTGYMALQNRIALLVETHMLKPYKERVFATLYGIEASLNFISDKKINLKKLNADADERSSNLFKDKNYFLPLSFKPNDKFENYLFKGFKEIIDTSEISGAVRTTYTNEKVEFNIPFYNQPEIGEKVTLPEAYLIPKEYSFIIERLKLHGVKYEELKTPKKMHVTKYKFEKVKLNASSYEGRQNVQSFELKEIKSEQEIPAGTYRVSMNQRTARVIANALEPKGPDSYLQWGFMNQIFEQKEYFEFYVMEKIAAEMLAEDPQLKKEFEEKLQTDEKFRKSSYQRLNFFYQRSPYFDKSLNVYPIMRVEVK